MSQTPSAPGALHADISRIIKYAPADFIGREAETKLLTDAWGQAVRREPKRPHVLTFVALGGEGKTSLVAKWAAELAHQDWPGCDAVFAWSFYSQGTREQTAVSSDAFLAEALGFFGDAEMAGSAAGAFDKGRRLARLVGQRRALLILDGLEPLQYAPTSPTPGELKDQGLAALLKALAATGLGLCVVTTRYAVPDLRAFWQTTAPMHELPRLSTAAGVKLLRTIGVKTGSKADFEKLVEDVDGHALTLQILGQFLVRAFHGDIRRRDRIDFEKADAKIQGGHAFRAMEAYVKWLEDDSEEARREVALLKLLGLFDRPATADCVAALRRAPAIPGLSEPLVGLAEDDWEFSQRLARCEAAHGEPGGRFRRARRPRAHPLLREYFARQLRRQQPETWRAAHRRLYEHLCATTQDLPQPTLEDLQPLYQAVAHGCQAGMQQEACDEVYRDRILRGEEYYSTKKLGAFGSDLGAVACFFEQPWSRVSPALTEADQAGLLNQAAFRLRALGRLSEALDPMRAGVENYVKQKHWEYAAITAGNLSELELTLAEVVGAVRDAEHSVSHADRSGDAFQRYSKRTTHADALHQAGCRAEAEARFREAEEMQVESQPNYPLLSSLQGFQYCDLLLTEAERAAWLVSGSG
ncbi:MAG: ATP-binding protein, partial [Pseudomonadota bacterium]|nr:ATP-binding protein [Pseudomonadota bacterium]